MWRFSGYGIVIGLITYLSIVIGELVPKQLALRKRGEVESIHGGPLQLASDGGELFPARLQAEIPQAGGEGVRGVGEAEPVSGRRLPENQGDALLTSREPLKAAAAQAAGISTVYQEVNLCDNLSIGENVMLGQEPRNALGIDWQTHYAAPEGKEPQEVKSGTRVTIELEGRNGRLRIHCKGATAANLAELSRALWDVARAQTEYRAAHGRYTASLRALGLRRPPDVDVRITADTRVASVPRPSHAWASMP